jgi:hypothetical protein
MAAERTNPVPIRLTAEERARCAALLAHFPELANLSDVLRQALTLGTLMMAVQATRPGQPMPYGGYAPDDLAALLVPRLLPALAFLQAQGALAPCMPSPPPAISQTMVNQDGLDQRSEVVEDDTRRYINQDAADELAAIGTDFLD